MVVYSCWALLLHLEHEYMNMPPPQLLTFLYELCKKSKAWSWKVMAVTAGTGLNFNLSFSVGEKSIEARF